MTKAETIMEKIAISAGIAVRSLERRLDTIDGAVLPLHKQFLKKRTAKQVSNISSLLAGRAQKASLDLMNSNAGASKLKSMASNQFNEERASQSFNYAASRLNNL